MLLHAGVTTRRDLLTRFCNSRLIIFRQRSPRAGHFVMRTGQHRQVRETRERVWLAQLKRQYELIFYAGKVWFMAPICPRQRGRKRDNTLFSSAILMRADFLACSADANELLDPAQLEATRPSLLNGKLLRY